MPLNISSSYRYQVGGSLSSEAQTYVVRQADHTIYQALYEGEFCYVFNARQTGKSSLRVRARSQLQQAGCSCTAIDITSIGSEMMLPNQWYKAIASELWYGFDLMEGVNFKQWWQAQAHLLPVQQLKRFIEEILLVHVSGERIVIFIDEIDSVLGLNFPLDDFFALLRFCYNQRAENPAYHRLVFALFGVTTPSDLIRDHSRTPFNIGRAIELRGFCFEEAYPLMRGLTSAAEHPDRLLREILVWTGGQPFLTQKLCQLVIESIRSQTTADRIQQGGEAAAIEHLVRSQLLEHWDVQDDPEHLRTIRDRLLRNEQHTGRLLGLYQQILQQGSVPANDSLEQIELLLSGLIIKQEGQLFVHNRIYAAVFDLDWINTVLAHLRPYAAMLNAWVKSNYQDESRLLRGQALQEAQIWADHHQLSAIDYQFLAASQMLNNREVQQAAHIAQAQLARQQEVSKLQRSILGTVSAALVVSAGLGLIALTQYRQALINEVKALVNASERSFALNQTLGALVEALKAKKELQQIWGVDAALYEQVSETFLQAAYRVREFNYLSGHTGTIYSVTFSPDGKLIASASRDNTIRLWQADGLLLKVLEGHSDRVQQVVFSPTGDLIASASQDGTIRLWQLDGTLVRKLEGYSVVNNQVVFSPDGKLLAAVAHDDQTIKLSQLDGTRIATLQAHTDQVTSLAFSPDGELLASASNDTTVKLWQIDPPHSSQKFGTLIATINGHQAEVNAVSFSPDGQLLASASDDHTIQFWKRDGSLIRILEKHTDSVELIAFSPDGKRLVSTSDDDTIKLWQLDGTVLQSFNAYVGGVQAIAFSPDGTTLASADDNNIIKLWRPESTLLPTIEGHTDQVEGVTASPDGQFLASASDDHFVKVWRRDGSLVSTFRGHNDEVEDVAFSPDGKLLVSVGEDNTVQIWRSDGTLLHRLEQHENDVEGVAFSPDGQWIASASDDRTVILWQRDGTFVRRLEGHTSQVEDVTFSPNSDLVASASEDGTAKIWRLDGTLLHTLNAHRGGVDGVAFSPDGQFIAVAGDDSTIKLWNREGQLLRSFVGHHDHVLDVAFSPDGQLLASASRDYTIKFWNLDGSVQHTLNGHSASVNSLMFSPDGRTLVSGGNDQLVILWDLQQLDNLENAMTQACHWVKDYLRSNARLTASDRQLCDDID